MVPINKGTDPRININIDAPRRSMKGILLLFVEPYTAGTRDSEKYIFPDLEKISVMINGKPGMLYNEGIKTKHIWPEVSRFFMKKKYKPQHMTPEMFYTKTKFRLLIDLRSMSGQEIHGSGTPLLNNAGVHLKIERDAKGTGTVNCHVFITSDAQFNILAKQLESVQY